MEEHISYGAMLLVLLFWAVIAIKAFKYWSQLKKAFLESGTKWPLHSQEELNANARSNLTNFYRISMQDMSQAARILFTMRTDNTVIQKPLRDIRLTFLAFVIFPIVFAVISVFVVALTQAR